MMQQNVVPADVPTEGGENIRSAGATGWIDIATALPPTQQRVLIAYTTRYGRRAVTVGWHCKARTLESGSFEGEVDEEYDEDADTYYMKEQWVDESVESEYHYPISDVTHWLPLPALPEKMEAPK